MPLQGVCVCVTDVRNLTLKTLLFLNILFPSFDLISSLKKYYFQKFLSKLVEVERKRFLSSAVVQRLGSLGEGAEVTAVL